MRVCKVVLLIFALLSSCGAGLSGLQLAFASPYTSVNAETAYNMITNGSYPNIVVLDVRSQGEYDSGHIYGAVWIPHSELEARTGELAGHEDHEIIVYCAAGVRSVVASEILDSHNFSKVYNMLGGLSEWESAGYPIWLATVHNLNTTFNYDTIQAAIDAPQTLDGHTIFAEAGTYYEHLFVNKSISLAGEDRDTTVIVGNGTDGVIKIAAYQVNVTGFTIRNGTMGIYIEESDLNVISGNIIADNQHGIHIFASCTCDPSSKNTITNNTIKNNGFGIYLESSNYNIIYHNNLVNNEFQTAVYELYSNAWDDGYSSGGNYWSNHNPLDLYSGTYQNETGSDGIGDTPYIIVGESKDRYPLVYPHGHVPSPDLNDDEIVDIFDVVLIAVAFWSEPGSSGWNPLADLNIDGVIDESDVATVAASFGKTV